LIAVTIAVSVGEMILSPVASALAATLAPPRLRGSYQAVVDLGFALSYMPGVVIGLWLVGAGHGTIMLALALPIGLLGVLCYLPLPRVPAEPAEPLPAPVAL